MLSLRSNLHGDGLLLMMEMQKGHNEAMDVLRSRVRSLEQEIESNKEDMSAILQIKDQLRTRSQECLELSTAFEEIEKENVESLAIAAQAKQAREDAERQLAEEIKRHTVEKNELVRQLKQEESKGEEGGASNVQARILLSHNSQDESATAFELVAVLSSLEERCKASDSALSSPSSLTPAGPELVS
ncbi:hypothetical protein GUITHDRAFT_100184 [Guillardia theta CCMP2712]|uniref:Uncharacterized protein n=1 Tax=Guillardia theta (strain CCMP2712) TaxID=905079 RepID=L1K056_GUITC|nr:hypothetical protein GUITHDRAFT_100184 [Guillardia theta CCMP2712]EKX53934.1 hypothetical protein GUITHDRAFT_100184 [Guillardia theta CCMP2712]|eukprot:XP_005840914.1 hypothetical protein GUITHDRAFT_100184 [Guillardia theta CCMP2712]